MQLNGSSSESFEIGSGVKQGCVIAQTLFWIFFGMLLKHVLDTTIEGIYFRIRSDGRLFNLAHLRATTKVREVLIRDMLFADDEAVATHNQEELQSLMDCFSQACKDFGLTISLKKTKCPGTGHRSTAGNYHRRLCTRCYLSVHRPRLHHRPPSPAI